MGKLLLGILLFVTPALSAECPVSVDFVNVGRTDTIFIRYTNTSNKDIKAAEFRAVLFDAVDRPHEAMHAFQMYGVKPGKQAHGSGSLFFGQHVEGANGAEVYATRVLFKDGTAWDDDGSRACSGVSKSREHHPSK